MIEIRIRYPLLLFFSSPSLSLLGSPVELGGCWAVNVTHHYCPHCCPSAILNFTGSHSSALNWCLDSVVTQQGHLAASLQMSSFVEANHRLDSKKCFVLIQDNFLKLYSTIFTQKLITLIKKLPFPPPLLIPLQQPKKLLTFAHVNLPAAVFYCLHSDILEGSLCPTGELGSWRQSLDSFTFAPLSWGGGN